MDKNLIIVIFLSGVLSYALMLVWNYFFPTKPAFTSEKDFKEFLKLNEKQYRQIVAEVKKEMAEEFLDLLKSRDEAINETIKEADENIRKKVNSAVDLAHNKVAVVATLAVNNHALIMSAMTAENSKETEQEREKRYYHFVDMQLEAYKDLKDLVHVRKS